MASNTPPPSKSPLDSYIPSSSPLARQASFMPPRSPSMAAPSPPPPDSPAGAAAAADAIPDSESETDTAGLPLTMTASVVLTGLPGDAKKALEKASSGGDVPIKITVYFHPLRDAPVLKQTRFKVPSTQPFGAVVNSLRKKLKIRESEGLWCYIDNFTPAPDEGVGGLYNCFKKGEELKVGYSITPTFG